MDAEKQYDCHSETSSEENDHQPEKSSDDTSSGGGSRFYECNFCKRGFTNAQALGGHMNIHRKEKKAKTKPKAKSGTAVSNISQDDVIRQQQYYSTDYQTQYHQQMNYQFYYPTANPSFPVAYHMISDFTAPDHHHLGIYEDHGIQAAHHEVAGGSTWNENEIDLELHL